MKSIKERLRDYGKLVRRLENQRERLQRIIANMQSPLTPTLTGMPRTNNVISDKTSRQIYIKTELENDIFKLEKEERAEYKSLTIFISKLEDPDEQTVITSRYIDFQPWEVVTFELFGDRWNYEEQHDTYQRRCYRLHGRALSHLDVLLLRK